MKAAGRILWAILLPLLLATPSFAAEGGEMPRIINFAILATILVVLLRKPIADYLNARTEEIRARLEEASSKIERAEGERQQADELLARLDDEVERARQEARRAAENERSRIVKGAEEEAARIRALAKKEVEAEVEAGRRRLLARATELSVDLAHRKLRSTMTDNDQRALIDRSIAMMGKAE